ncbi:peptidoglycan DD-metalloendopeptidase family protein [Shewanella aestuarii]|uniref:Peptidoglycan DD-metalloendopeptidase family protein n=2 Tax=Shewanella aestuarii TaxID=1028752 RepID=A0A6G9QH34_9GAMM|nr:peptidoglycan DD-metalloendopeptidase family protein [Shewanella aestuarii]
MHLCWPLVVIFGLFMSGCSFQAHTPAPVENISSTTLSPKYERGSLKSTSYQVKKGDTLYSISWGAGRNFSDVAKQNNLKEPYTIFPGQTLIIGNYAGGSTKNSNKNTDAVVNKIASDKPRNVTNSSKNSKSKQAQTQSQPAKSSNLNSAKKTLDHKAKPAYSVTTDQQKINQNESPQIADLPDKVQKWYWPVKGKIIGYFSSSEQGNQGVKIAGNRGDIIRAAADGRVVYAGDALRGYGNLVIIKHNDDFLSAYAHADTILVKEKQYVSAGQTVAKMGSTGTNQVMLHFEIRYHGKSVNPLRYLPKQ